MAPPPFNRPPGGGFRPGPKPPFKKPGFKREEEQSSDGPRINGQIRVAEVRVIGHDGEQLGILTPAEAIAMAEARGLDLVEVSPTASPPVCKILDFGKYRYELQKKAKEAKKKQKVIEIKEIKLRPNIDTNDYNVKLRAIHKFIDEGDKVKVTLRLRGREMAHMDIAMDLLKKLQVDVTEIAKIESPPKPEGRQVVMVLSPLKS